MGFIPREANKTEGEFVLNYEEWIHLGNLVKKIEVQLMKERLNYPKTSFEARRILQALDWLDKTRDKLDDVVCKQFPDEITNIAVFYGCELKIVVIGGVRKIVENRGGKGV